MNKWLGNLSNLIFLAALIYLIYQKAPSIYEHYQAQGIKIPAQQMNLISGEKIDLAKSAKPYAIVFWATWCGPCDIELLRLQKMITNGDINAESVIAVSIGEELTTVAKAAKERNYTFLVATDESYNIANAFKVKGTPTVVLVNQDMSIEWISTGISPSLEFRVKKHLIDN